MQLLYRKITAVIGVAAILAALLITVSIQKAGASSVTPEYVAGNPTCQDLGYEYGYKPNSGGAENNPKGTFNVGTGTVTVTSSDTAPEIKTLSWTSTIGIDAVIVKAGDGANVYKYNPESFGDSNLITPNNNGGQQAGLSHLVFCYDYEVQITKTANTTYSRDWDWTIEKSADQTDLTLAPGQTFTVNYSVNVGATSTDSNWAVSGTVTLTNPDPSNSANITSVVDTMSVSGTVILNCGGQAFPTTLASGQSINCTYSVALNGPTNQNNTVTVTTTGKVGGNTATVPVTFGAPTSENDECINVDDNKYGSLGTLCSGAAPKTYTYSLNVGPYERCGEYVFSNIASYLTNDSATTDSSSWDVNVTVPCVVGCTLTQGYWKTHSKYGPAPYDDNWMTISEDAVFFKSGQTWYNVFWTAPKGNVYYNLAHQYMAAVLNKNNGASVPSSVNTALTQAYNLLNTYTPAQVAAFKSNNTTRAQFVTLAGILGAYNEGITGPGHCDQ